METLAGMYAGIEKNAVTGKLRPADDDCHASDETLAALADSGIRLERRKAIILHLANCRQCRQIMSDIVLSRAYVQDPD